MLSKLNKRTIRETDREINDRNNAMDKTIPKVTYAIFRSSAAITHEPLVFPRVCQKLSDTSIFIESRQIHVSVRFNVSAIAIHQSRGLIFRCKRTFPASHPTTCQSRSITSCIQYLGLFSNTRTLVLRNPRLIPPGCLRYDTFLPVISSCSFVQTL